jgi:hypothetical protein
MTCKTSRVRAIITAKRSTICEVVISEINVLINQQASGLRVTVKQRHGAGAALSAGEYAGVIA